MDKLEKSIMKEIQSIQEFQNIVEGDKLVLVDFYAEWCGSCKTLLPIIEKLARKYADTFEIIKVNVDKSPELSQQFSVRSIPALFFIKDGKIVENILGLRSEMILSDKIERHLN